VFDGWRRSDGQVIFSPDRTFFMASYAGSSKMGRRDVCCLLVILLHASRRHNCQFLQPHMWTALVLVDGRSCVRPAPVDAGREHRKNNIQLVCILTIHLDLPILTTVLWANHTPRTHKKKIIVLAGSTSWCSATKPSTGGLVFARKQPNTKARTPESYC
jgi:hypothetical protein